MVRRGRDEKIFWRAKVGTLAAPGRQGRVEGAHLPEKNFPGRDRSGRKIFCSRKIFAVKIFSEELAEKIFFSKKTGIFENSLLGKGIFKNSGFFGKKIFFLQRSRKNFRLQIFFPQRKIKPGEKIVGAGKFPPRVAVWEHVP